MNVSTYIQPLTRYGTPERIVDVLKECGYNDFDFSMMFPIKGFDFFFESENYKEKAYIFKNYIDSKGMRCNQTHGSVPCIRNSASGSELKDMFEKVKRTIEITSILGARYCVLHPASDCTMEENVKFFNTLKEIANTNKVVIAIENTLSGKLFGKPSDIKRLLECLNDEHFKACLDIGHSETISTGSSALEFIKELRSEIVCLHIHDNDKNIDLHQLPFTFSIEFDAIFKSLKKAGFSGDITFECGTFFDNIPFSLLKDSLKFLHDIGEYIKNKYFE